MLEILEVVNLINFNNYILATNKIIDLINSKS